MELYTAFCNGNDTSGEVPQPHDWDKAIDALTELAQKNGETKLFLCYSLNRYYNCNETEKNVFLSPGSSRVLDAVGVFVIWREKLVCLI
eukprot:COSAG02_NODE_482_length_21409_cov_126.131018_2_plen_89_part_00